jgi:superfamily II DNA/RNA helicase
MTDSLDMQGAFAPAESFDIAIDGASDLPQAQDSASALPNGFLQLGLAPELIQAVEDLGYTQPTAVQDKVIPLAMDNSAEGESSSFIDLMVSSQTGSGKTAAFLLPVLHTLLKRQAEEEERERLEFQRQVDEAAARGEAVPKRKRRNPTDARHFKAATPGALVLCPTRELAQQVAHDAIELVKHCKGLRIANVVGGMPYQLQIARLQNADLVVATPGRLLDLQRSQQLKLDQVKFLVVDEADRMLDLGFADDLAEVNQLTIARHQTMMFSATFAPRIQQLAVRVMREPQRVQIDSPQEKHANIKQVLFWADNAQHKRKLLDHWLRDTTINQAIVFASTQIECDGLANDLQQEGFSAVALHGALSQGIRNRRLMALRNGQVQILVATDVAARGIDVPTITHVFNFGLPMKSEDYTHRIGRTGRAGRDGLAVTFAEFRDRFKIFDIEGYTKQAFTAETIPGLEPQARAPRAPQGFGGGRPGGRSGPRSGGGGGGFGAKRTGGSFDREGYGRKTGFGDFGGGGGDRRGGGDFRPDLRSAEPRGGDFRGNDFRGGDNRAATPWEKKPATGFGRPAPHGDFGGGAPAPRGDFARPGNGGKVFVPRDAKKRAYKPAR